MDKSSILSSGFALLTFRPGGAHRFSKQIAGPFVIKNSMLASSDLRGSPIGANGLQPVAKPTNMAH